MENVMNVLLTSAVGIVIIVFFVLTGMITALEIIWQYEKTLCLSDTDKERLTKGLLKKLRTETMVFSFFVIFIMSISLLRGFVQSAKPSDILAYVFIGLILGVLRVVNRSGDIARKEIGGVMPRIENLPKIHLAGIISMITLWGSIIAEIIKNYLTEDPSKTLPVRRFPLHRHDSHRIVQQHQAAEKRPKNNGGIPHEKRLPKILKPFLS